MVNESNDDRNWDIMPENEKINEILDALTLKTRDEYYEWYKLLEIQIDPLYFSAPKHKLEAKTETYGLVFKTGNALIEMKTKYKGTNYYKDTGFSITEADGVVLTYCDEDRQLMDMPVLLFTTEYLFKVIRENNIEAIYLPEPTEFGDMIYAYLVPLYLLLEPLLMLIQPHQFDILKEKRIEMERQIDIKNKKRVREVLDERVKKNQN